MQDILAKAKELICEADALLITAGAGMGVDSGLPDFRGIEGFWRAYPAIKNLGLHFEEMANPKWFEEDPSLAWAFYGHRLNLYRQTVPHDGFLELLELGKKKKDGYFVFTSNVDGQFQKAGYDENKIVEVHGSINHFQCSKNCTNQIWKDRDTFVEIEKESFRACGELPTCLNCGEIARPNILMFGDWGWNSQRTDIQSHRLQSWLDSASKIVILEFGAGLSVPTIRFFGENITSRYDAALIRVNPRDADVPKNQISISLGAREAIGLLL
jgi:NAD-dependent SIR2 family protein deacetylase